MIIYYSGEENKSLPEYVLEDAHVMLTYWLHGKSGKPSSRFKKLRRARKLVILEREEDNATQS